MENAWENIQPKNIYQGLKRTPLKEEARESLLFLYQPIIAGDALSLYLTLLSECSADTGKSQESLHADLFSSLNYGVTQFYEARKKLEGIGLLTTYVKQDTGLGTIFYYELNEPMSPMNFFKDAVLSFLLLEKVGDRRFDVLKNKFEPKQFNFSEYTNITKKFLDVYRFSEKTFASDSAKIESTAASFKEEKQPQLIERKQSLDWELLNSLLSKKYIPTLDQEAIDQAELYHQLYGLDTMEIEELLVSAYDFSAQKVDLKQLQNSVRKHDRRSPSTPQEQENGTSNEKQASASEETVSTELLTENTNDQTLINESRQYAPMIYLEAIKAGKNGFVSNSEKYLLKSLVQNSNLPNSVLNILINYVLVIQDNASLTATYVNTIANEWAQKKITTPEAAIAHIRETRTQAKKRTTKKAANSTYRKVRREKLPDWANNPTVPTEEPVDNEKQAALERRFNEYMAKKEGDS
ncbi:MAG: replication initiation and membrane attachment family protein [Enterococcus sp.]